MFCNTYVSHSMNLFHDDLLWVKIWDFGFWENKICLFMRMYWKDYFEDETTWESKELSVHIILISSAIRYVLIWFCLIKFHGRYICQILRIPCISFEWIRLSSITFGKLFFWFGFSMICLFWGNRDYFWPTRKIHEKPSFISLHNLIRLRFITFQFRGRNFLLKGKNCKTRKSVFPKFPKYLNFLSFVNLI